MMLATVDTSNVFTDHSNANASSDDAFTEFKDEENVVVVSPVSSSSSSRELGHEERSVADDHQELEEDDKVQEDGGDGDDENPAVVYARRVFHSRRFIKLKNMPPDATEQDVRHLLKPLSVNDVQLNRVSETAKVTLVTPDCLESFPSERRHTLNDRYVVVAPSNTEGMLCVAHLPIGYTDHDFRNLVQMFGAIARCFLMRNERTGESKGYGFVEYASKDVAYHAKGRLDGRAIGDSVLYCNWLDSSHVTYRSLHSKCIYVDHLPPSYRNLIEFREVFGTIANPSYCQIAMRNGQPLGFGLVEFDLPQEAEEVQLAMNCYQLDNHKIRVTFCIPGYRAMVIYNKLTSCRVGSHPKQPLLPDPTSSNVKSSAAFDQLRNWTTRNPQIFQALQTLMVQNRLVGISNPTNGCVPSSTHQQRPQSQSQDSSFSAAVILLLATQLQSEMNIQQPSSGNNQLLSIVQNLLKKQDSIPVQDPKTDQDLQSIYSSLINSISNGSCSSSGQEEANASWKSKESPSSDNRPYHSCKMPLLPDPPSASRKTTAGLLPRPQCPPLSNEFNSYVHHQHSASALAHGHASPSAYQSSQSKPPLLGQKPFNGHASTMSPPLLGEKPAFVPNCNVSQNGSPAGTPTTPVGRLNPDADFLERLLALAQCQQQRREPQTGSNIESQVPTSNFMFGQCPQSQGILAHLQMQGDRVREMGGCGAMGTTGNFANMLQMAANRNPMRESHPNIYGLNKLDGLMGPCGPSVLTGSNQYGPICTMPQAVPLQLPTTTTSTKRIFFPGGGAMMDTVADHNRKFNVQNNFLGPSLTSTNFGVPLQPPLHPILVSQLFAGVQQRRSVLGDFWQFSQGTIFNNAQMLGVKRKLQVVMPDNKIASIGMRNPPQPPHFKRRRS